MEKTMFRLFGYALCGENEKETISLDRESWEKIYKLSKKHDLAHLIGYALKAFPETTPYHSPPPSILLSNDSNVNTIV